MPLTGAHFGTGRRRTRRVIEKESNDQIIAFVYEEAAEFVEPQGAVNTLRLSGDQERGFASYGCNVVRVFGLGIMVVQGFQMLLELECRVELGELLANAHDFEGIAPTSPNGTRGGPAAMSAALVPG